MKRVHSRLRRFYFFPLLYYEKKKKKGKNQRHNISIERFKRFKVSRTLSNRIISRSRFFQFFFFFSLAPEALSRRRERYLHVGKGRKIDL